MNELEQVIENIVPTMHEFEHGEFDLDAKKLAVEYPAPLKKLIEVFGPVSHEHKLHIHIEEYPHAELTINFDKPSVLAPTPVETYRVKWHKKGVGCGYH